MMRAAPAVSVCGSGGWPWRALQTACLSVAVGCMSNWLLLRGLPASAPADSAWLAALALSLAVAVVAWRLSRTEATHLTFGGSGWLADGLPVEPELMVDLDSAVLLRLRFGRSRRVRWLALTASEVGASWHGLRVALHARSRLPQPSMRAAAIQRRRRP